MTTTASAHERAAHTEESPEQPQPATLPWASEAHDSLRRPTCSAATGTSEAGGGGWGGSREPLEVMTVSCRPCGPVRGGVSIGLTQARGWMGAAATPQPRQRAIGSKSGPAPPQHGRSPTEPGQAGRRILSDPSRICFCCAPTGAPGRCPQKRVHLFRRPRGARGDLRHPAALQHLGG